MKIFGITGGTGAGKSTVSEEFRRQGIYVIDADKTARAVVEKGKPCLNELVVSFGREILNDDETLNRKKLGEIVFSDKKKLEILNQITHKYIQSDIEAELKKVNPILAAIDGAVIIGSPIEKMCEFLVSVIADNDIRVKRIMMRDNISEEMAQMRINSQPNDKFYVANSKFLVYNNNSRDIMVKKIGHLIQTIREGFGLEVG